jgi:hypothetical protein
VGMPGNAGRASRSPRHRAGCCGSASMRLAGRFRHSRS